jgi:hypothetical protein
MNIKPEDKEDVILKWMAVGLVLFIIYCLFGCSVVYSLTNAHPECLTSRTIDWFSGPYADIRPYYVKYSGDQCDLCLSGKVIAEYNDKPTAVGAALWMLYGEPWNED